MEVSLSLPPPSTSVFSKGYENNIKMSNIVPTPLSMLNEHTTRANTSLPQSITTTSTATGSVLLPALNLEENSTDLLLEEDYEGFTDNDNLNGESAAMVNDAVVVISTDIVHVDADRDAADLTGTVDEGNNDGVDNPDIDNLNHPEDEDAEAEDDDAGFPSPPCVILEYRSDFYTLFSALPHSPPPGSTTDRTTTTNNNITHSDEDVLYFGGFDSDCNLFIEPLTSFTAALKKSFSIDNDVTIEFPALALSFPESRLKEHPEVNMSKLSDYYTALSVHQGKDISQLGPLRVLLLEHSTSLDKQIRYLEELYQISRQDIEQNVRHTEGSGWDEAGGVGAGNEQYSREAQGTVEYDIEGEEGELEQEQRVQERDEEYDVPLTTEPPEHQNIVQSEHSGTQAGYNSMVYPGVEGEGNETELIDYEDDDEDVSPNQAVSQIISESQSPTQKTSQKHRLEEDDGFTGEGVFTSDHEGNKKQRTEELSPADHGLQPVV